MSDTPHRNHRNWRWKWKRRKHPNKNRLHHGSRHQLDNLHGNNHLSGDEEVSVSSHKGHGSSPGSCGHFDGRNPGTPRSEEVPHQRTQHCNEATHAARSNGHSHSQSCDYKRMYGTEQSKQRRTKSQRKASSGSCTASQTMQNGSGNSCDTGASTSEQSSSPKTIKEIPGFYYDPVKKRYFRLVPGHNNHNPLTKEAIDKREAEKKRQEMLNSDRSISRKQGAPLKRNVLFCPLQRSLQTGQLSSRQFMRYAQEQAISNLDLRPSKLTDFPDQYFDGESGDISFLQVDRSQRKILMVISHDYLSRMWQGTITCDPSKPRSVTVSDWKVINIIGTRITKVTSASWVSTDNPEDLQIIYSLSGGPMSSVQLLRCPRDEDGHNHITYSYESNHESAWTCTWSNNTVSQSYLSIGSSSKAIVVDTVTACKWKVFTNHSDVLAQVFSTRNPVLYNGTRRGEILGCDLRSLTQTRSDITLRLRHKVAVCSVRLLKDENYLLASDMSGQIRLWDLRQCLCVKEYEGHYNRHANLPISIDSTETVLYGVGQDSHTRLWSLHDSRLLRTIPCPQPPSHLNPAVIYSQEWHQRAPPGILLGVQRHLYWYPL